MILADSRRLFQTVIFVATVAGFNGSAKAAPKKSKERPPAGVSAPAEVKGTSSSQLRLWKACSLPAGGTLRIRLLLGSGKPAKDGLSLSENANRYEIGDYRDVPAGVGNVEISVLPGESRTLLPVYLPAGGNATLLVQVQGGEVRTEFVDDRSMTAANSHSFNVFNLLLGLKSDVQVNAGDAVNAHVLSPGGSLRLNGIKPANYLFSASGTDGEGKSFRWNGETDLRKVRRATLLICPDVYGRIRPRLIEEGAIDAPAKSDG